MKVFLTAAAITLAAAGIWAADTRMPSGAATPPAAAKTTKRNPVVVVIDVGKIVRESNFSKAIQAEFQTWGETMKTAMQPKGEALQAKQKAFKAEEAKLAPAEKQKREKEIEALQAEFGTLQQAAQQEYRQRQQDAEERMRTAFDPLLDAVAKENGWDVILNKADKLLWSSDAVDQTDLVLAKFNALPPPAPTAAPAAPASAPAASPAKK